MTSLLEIKAYWNVPSNTRAFPVMTFWLFASVILISLKDLFSYAGSLGLGSLGTGSVGLGSFLGSWFSGGLSELFSVFLSPLFCSIVSSSSFVIGGLLS